tara:strand:+ start:62604 stop:63251 length:648 start_codon:yes stop_codon:yes gene_type:complete
MTNRILLAALLLVFSNACTEDSVSDNASALIGEWIDCVDADSTFTFGVDNSYAYDETCSGEGCEEDHLSGTFEAQAQRLTTHAASPEGDIIVQAFSYYANANNLVLGAGYPQGSHDGVVGTWTSQRSTKKNGLELGATEQTIVLKADQTGTVTEYLGSSKTFEASGTWGPDLDPENAGGFELEVTPDGESFTISLSFQLIDEAVLGSPRFCRVTN